MKLFLAVAALALAVTSVLPPGPSGTIQFGDPARTGEQTTTVKVSYTDAQGKKQEKTITATTPLTPDDTPQTKTAKVKENLDAELDKDANKVNGQPLGSTGGSGNAMTISPANDSAGNFSDVKIEKITTDDSKTGEKDTVNPPALPAVGQIEVNGDVTGTDGTSASFFEVHTNLGTVTVQLTAGMRKPSILRQLAAGLQAQGATTWVDTDRMVLLVYVPGGENQVSSLGAGSTDQGLTARAGLLSGN
jgi:hypothetical protein